MKMGLTRTDLVGKMESVEILEMSESTKDDKQIVILKCLTSQNKQLDVGLFGDKIADDVLEKHGISKNGKNHLNLPASRLKDGGIVWVNAVY